ncbi:MAG: hypothetical protein FWH55_14225 [Oscillospiraceae bacterium]|nr:hypothetical protein [Oscillospiraceae bacterium]
MYILDEINGQINKNDTEKRNFSSDQGDINFSADFDLTAFLDENRGSLPHVLVEDNSIAYILITELPDKLNEWICNGKTKEDSFHVLSDDREKELKAICRRLKLEGQVRIPEAGVRGAYSGNRVSAGCGSDH